jgi:dienelactone hydrolase
MNRRTALALLAAPALADDVPRQLRLARMEAVMGPMPALPATPPRWRITRSDKLDAYTRHRIDYEAEPCDEVPAYLLVPHQLQARNPAMLCLHQTTRIGKAEPAGMGPKVNLHYAKELAERGYVTLAPDYPNFGDYRIDVYARGYASASMKGIVNHFRAVDLLQSLPYVDAGRMGVIGHSLGGHNSLFAAAFDTRLTVAVTSCGFTLFSHYKGGDLTGWSHAGYMPRIATHYDKSPSRMPFDFTDVLAAIAPRKIFICAPVGDSNFDVEGVRKCVAAVSGQFPSGRLQVEYPDAGHDFPPETRLRAYEFAATP